MPIKTRDKSGREFWTGDSWRPHQIITLPLHLQQKSRMCQCLSEDLRYEGRKTEGSFGVLEERHYAELSATLVSNNKVIRNK